MSEQELLDLLQAYAVPLDTWGAGEAKTFGHLLKEVQSGEAVVTADSGRLMRTAYGAVLIIKYNNGVRTWELREDRQVFKDGRTKRRDMGSLVGEKMRPGESSLEAAYRALSEELGIAERLMLTPLPNIVKGPVPSQSYPGLLTLYIMYVYEVVLPERWYKPEGYVEHQEDKSSYFVWV